MTIGSASGNSAMEVSSEEHDNKMKKNKGIILNVFIIFGIQGYNI